MPLSQPNLIADFFAKPVKGSCRGGTGRAQQMKTRSESMKNVVVRLMVVFALAALVALPALADPTFQANSSRRSELILPQTARTQIAAEPIQVADGPGPVPWPKGAASLTRKHSPRLLADGPGPVPWPKGAGSLTRKHSPRLLADGPGPVPWPKGLLQPASAGLL
jgi:hypothetical protein